jgi:ribosomal protein L32
MAKQASSRTTSKTKHAPLWRCPKCGERFVTKNLWHSCGKYKLEDLFARSEPHVLSLFKKFAKMLRACGPVRMIPQKTRVVFQVRVRFAGAYPRKSYVLCSIALPYRAEDPRFVKIEDYAEHFRGHMFKVSAPADLDSKLQRWLHESYKVGAQDYLDKRPKVRVRRKTHAPR